MAKRFIDTGTFRTGFLRSLPPEYKLFYLYLLCECDHCGIWSVEIDVAELRIGAKIDLNQARKYFQNQVIEFEDGQKWFIPGFISFQYGSIDEQRNKIHQSIYNTLNTNNLLQYLNSINEGLPNPSVTVTEPFPKGEVTPIYKYKDKEKDKDKDKEKEKPKIESLDLVFDEVEILDHELIEWVKKECPDVAKMKEPLTNEQAANLETEYSIDDLKEILLAMQNRPDLNKKYKSTNLTCRKWLKNKQNYEKSSPSSSKSSTESSGSYLLDWAARQANNPFITKWNKD